MQDVLRSIARFFWTPAESTERSAPAGMWDAAAGGNRWRGTVAPQASPGTYYGNNPLARARAEAQYRNNGYGRRAVRAIAAAVTGANGIVPSFQNAAYQAAWEEWQKRVQYGGRFDWAAFLQLAVRTMVASGDAFIVALPDSDVREGVPLRLMLLGAEYLDTSRSGRDTFGGIEYDGLKPTGYWFFQANPATVSYTGVSRLVPGDFVYHLFDPITPGAQRGQTWLSPALLPLKELDEYLESQLVRAKTAAMFAGFVRSPEGSQLLSNAAGVPALEPGTMTRLMANEEVTFTDPPDVGASFDPFVRSQLRRIAAAMDMPYEVLSGDYSQVTFASGRGALLRWRETIEVVQYTLVVPALCEPLLQLWMRFAKAAGVVSGDPGKIRWVAPVVEMLDKRAEVQSVVAEIRAGLISRAEVVARRGWRVEDIDAEIAADNARADRLGLVLDSDPRRVTQQGQGQIEAATEPEAQPA